VKTTGPGRWRRALISLAALAGLLALLLAGPLSVMASGTVDLSTPWYAARQDRTGQAPDPALERQAVVQVYGARAVRWRGAFAIHPWIAVKREGAAAYTTYQVFGWRAMRGTSCSPILFRPATSMTVCRATSSPPCTSC
jgi:hypothetical protein